MQLVRRAPFHTFPDADPGADDIGALIEQHRDAFPFHENLITFDPPEHTAHTAP